MTTAPCRLLTQVTWRPPANERVGNTRISVPRPRRAPPKCAHAIDLVGSRQANVIAPVDRRGSMPLAVPTCPSCAEPLVLRWKRRRKVEAEPIIACSSCGRPIGHILDWIPGDPPPVPAD